MKAQPMETAPRDGSRILLRGTVRRWDDESETYAAVGTQWIEGYFCNGGFREWPADPWDHDCAGFEPTAWAPVPEEF